MEEKREKLYSKQKNMKEKIEIQQEMLTEADTVLIQNLPLNFNKAMLKELLAKYPGVEEIQMNQGENSAFVRFMDNSQAKMVLAGIYIGKLRSVGLNKFNIDKEGNQLKVTFAVRK